MAGERYGREGGVPGYARWGQQRGSVYLADQQVATAVARVKDRRRGQEVPLSAYQALQGPRRVEDASLRKVLFTAHAAWRLVRSRRAGILAPMSARIPSRPTQAD